MSLPQHCPTPRELDDLELLSVGALAPLTGFEGPDGLITLVVPGEVAEQAQTAGGLEFIEPEGTPLARLTIESTYETETGTGLVGPVEVLTRNEVGPFRRLHLTPAEVGERYGDTALTVPVAGPLSRPDLAIIRAAADSAPIVLLALAGTGTPQGLSPVGLVRATLAAAQDLPGADVVVAPLASRGDADADHDLGSRVTAAYAPGDVLALTGSNESDLPGAVAVAVALDNPPPDEVGLVVFFTGLSGSGKSTIARALHDVILESGERTVTSLDGDLVRRNLSAGLSFSKADRETNIRRIGWVAAEISRHGGVAICSPIAPFDETRRQVRTMVEDAGGEFVLVHVATPLEECERRDKKGLYAKARAGQIPEFTGISSPYEEPEDAALRLDTTGRSIEDCLDEVLGALASYVPALSRR
ncbi:MAG: adenylyl-sulfate kinase [Nocardioides sp.]|nr:adenylyl-sulfate kinase [Nocardioides sp.]